MTTTNTVRPTFEGHADGEDITMEYGADFEARVIAYCRDIGATGASIFDGGNGPVYGTEGYEDNYCGWIDAR